MGIDKVVGKYFPYGQERPSATTDGKEKFATYFRDSETGLDYAQNRYHQPGMAAWTFNIVDGTASNLLVGDAYGSAQLGQAAQAFIDADAEVVTYLITNTSHEHATVQDYFGAKQGMSAWTPFGGSTIYIAAGRMNNLGSDAQNQALLMHELLHMKFGLDDGDILDKLYGAGSRYTRPSYDITVWIRDNCN